MGKHLVRNLGIFGGLLVVISIAFEFVRMRPDYRLIVEPWSIRGYDLTQGKVVAAIGIGMIALTILASLPKGSMLFNVLVGFGAWLAAVLIAQFPDPPEVGLELASFFGIVISLVFSYIITKTVLNLIGDRIADERVKYYKWGTLAVVFSVMFFVLAKPTFVSPNSLDIELSVLIAILFGIVVIAAIVAQPREMAVARLTIIAALASWTAVGTIGTGARVKLVESQIEIMGVSGAYRDTQITSGLMIAFAGMLILFLASVGLWAKKRDRLQTLARSRRQQQAAQESKAELVGSEPS